ncbi:amidohydrolase family protein [Burkholderia alba]|uniref:amidohydrolase family protein n=1 Tax=Burkholderia alba TaxID=2683677 RepID=UPI002B0585B8|nr:amidohydrolase family protein [Burkholderia alba]
MSEPLPAGACDCAIHVYDPAHGPDAHRLGRVFPWATVAAYRKVQARLGTARTVVVQANAYTFDHHVLEHALAAFGDSARGVAIVGPETPRAELIRLHAAGVRGARLHLLGERLLMGWDAVPAVASRIAELGWHLQIQLDGRTLPEHEAMLRQLPCPLVIDHIGKFLEPVPPTHPAFRSLLRLLNGGRCWLKLSSPYEVSRCGPPDWPDVGELAREAARAAPARMLWGSNWPHVGTDTPPDDPALLDALTHWVPDARQRRRILVDNPAELYGW